MPPQSALGKALAYTTKQWRKLVRHLEHADMPRTFGTRTVTGPMPVSAYRIGKMPFAHYPNRSMGDSLLKSINAGSD